MMGNGISKEESVDELLQKLAKKGKKVKLLDESASVKELPRQEDLDDELDSRDEADDLTGDTKHPSPSKKQKNKRRSSSNDINEDDQDEK